MEKKSGFPWVRTNKCFLIVFNTLSFAVLEFGSVPGTKQTKLRRVL